MNRDVKAPDALVLEVDQSANLITDEVIALMAGSLRPATHDFSDPSYERPLLAARPAVPDHEAAPHLQ